MSDDNKPAMVRVDHETRCMLREMAAAWSRRERRTVTMGEVLRRIVEEKVQEEQEEAKR